jgi:hypothetical protein
MHPTETFNPFVWVLPVALPDARNLNICSHSGAPFPFGADPKIGPLMADAP